MPILHVTFIIPLLFITIDTRPHTPPANARTITIHHFQPSPTTAGNTPPSPSLVATGCFIWREAIAAERRSSSVVRTRDRALPSPSILTPSSSCLFFLLPSPPSRQKEEDCEHHLHRSRTAPSPPPVRLSSPPREDVAAAVDCYSSAHHRCPSPITTERRGSSRPCLLSVPPRRRPPTYCMKNHRGRHCPACYSPATTRRRRPTTSHLPPSSIADDSPHQVSHLLLCSPPPLLPSRSREAISAEGQPSSVVRTRDRALPSPSILTPSSSEGGGLRTPSSSIKNSTVTTACSLVITTERGRRRCRGLLLVSPSPLPVADHHREEGLQSPLLALCSTEKEAAYLLHQEPPRMPLPSLLLTSHHTPTPADHQPPSTIIHRRRQPTPGQPPAAVLTTAIVAIKVTVGEAPGEHNNKLGRKASSTALRGRGEVAPVDGEGGDRDY
ncbi:hypothetical protein Dimus_020934 [Dionaea muscipula]